MIAPADRKGGFAQDDLTRENPPQTFRPLKGGNFRPLDDDVGITCDLQDIACGKIGKNKAGLGIGEDISQRIEKQVSGKIGDGQAAIGINADKSGFAATV